MIGHLAQRSENKKTRNGRRAQSVPHASAGSRGEKQNHRRKFGRVNGDRRQQVKAEARRTSLQENSGCWVFETGTTPVLLFGLVGVPAGSDVSAHAAFG